MFDICLAEGSMRWLKTNGEVILLKVHPNPNPGQ